jgi:hypothetical protein
MQKLALVGCASALAACSAILGLPDATEDPSFVPPGTDGSIDSATGDGSTGTDGTTAEDAPVGPDGSACPGKDLSKDMANCGACGFDCTNGVSCTDGVCVLKEGLKSPIAIRGNASGLYIAVYYSQQIVRCAHNGCASGVTVVVEDAGQANALEIRDPDPNVYWTNWPQTNGTVARASLDGGPVLEIAPNEAFLHGLAIDSTHVYFAGSDGVARCPLSGCPGGVAEVLVADGEGDPNDVALNDAGVLAWTTYNGVVRSCNKSSCDGSAPSTAVASSQNDPGTIVLDNTKAYWVNYGTGSFAGYDPKSGTVGSCAIGGNCGSNTQNVAFDINKPRDAFIEGGDLFWVNSGLWPDDLDGGAPDGTVWRCKASDCKNTTKLVAGGQKSPVSVWADKSAVYWTNRNRGGGIADGSISKAPR